jgi:hypothetical protein
MKILITGGTGFLGRHIVWRLAAQGHEIVFTGRDHRQADAVIRAMPPGLSGSARFGALSHGHADTSDKLLQYAAGAKAVVHCAGLAAPWGSPAAFHAANVASTREVLAACSSHGIGTLVHISTPSIYFRFADCIGIREDDPLPPPVNAYARRRSNYSPGWRSPSGYRSKTCTALMPSRILLRAQWKPGHGWPAPGSLSSPVIRLVPLRSRKRWTYRAQHLNLATHPASVSIRPSPGPQRGGQRRTRHDAAHRLPTA